MTKQELLQEMLEQQEEILRDNSSFKDAASKAVWKGALTRYKLIEEMIKDIDRPRYLQGVGNRLTRSEAMDFLKCGDCRMREYETQGLLKGTYYTVGTRRYYITEKLTEWILNGGEEGARERLQIPAPERGKIYIS